MIQRLRRKAAIHSVNRQAQEAVTPVKRRMNDNADSDERGGKFQTLPEEETDVNEKPLQKPPQHFDQRAQAAQADLTQQQAQADQLPQVQGGTPIDAQMEASENSEFPNSNAPTTAALPSANGKRMLDVSMGKPGESKDGEANALEELAAPLITGSNINGNLHSIQLLMKQEGKVSQSNELIDQLLESVPEEDVSRVERPLPADEPGRGEEYEQDRTQAIHDISNIGVEERVKAQRCAKTSNL